MRHTEDAQLKSIRRQKQDKPDSVGHLMWR